jgi:hypothetical protein
LDQALSISRGAALSALAVLCALPTAALEKHCSIHAARYRGWSAQEIRNEWVTVTIVPRLGGRLMQVTFGPHDYLFVNKAYEGKYLPPVEPNAAPRWYNYGGDKIWPLPEGRKDPQNWPGPIADALDDGDYTFSIVSQGSACKVRLDGPPDARTGLQYSREIALQGDSPQISFHAVMKNASNHPIEWSVQSVTQYSTADASERKASTEIWGFTAANEQSSYPGGFLVRSGNPPPAGLSIKNGLVALNYGFLEYELWFDTQGGWLAIADNATQYAMVERFRIEKDKEYPGKATVIFYTNGSEPPDADLYYMEAEINSPMARLQPGETYAMDTEWYPARAGKDVLGVTDAGVIVERLRIWGAPGKQKISGKFGVFFEGKIVAKFLDKDGKAISAKTLRGVTPKESVKLDAEVLVPAGAKRIALYVIDSQARERGLLDEVPVAPGGASD